MSTVVVTGATGLIGGAVVRALTARGDAVVALARDPQRAREQLGPDTRVLAWPDAAAPPPVEALGGADAVVHLLGEPIAQRWSEEVKRRIRDSRVLGTRSLVAAIEAADPRPRVLVSQSATGYYGARGDERLDEGSAPGEDFLAAVVRDWETEAGAAAGLGLRVAVTRTGVVLAASGGALAKMLPPFKAGIGGPVAGGRQYLPWVHLSDVAGAILHCLDDEAASGPLNVTAPEPATNADFSRALGRVLHRPALAPVPGVALKLLYGEMAMIVLTGQRAVPRRLLEQGYEFRRPALEPALRDVLAAPD
jgi:uncharacterized protein (TIGR01777 family)